RGAEITVEEEPRVLPRMMDQDGADMAARWLERRGVRVLTSRRLEQITAENDDGPRRLHLDGGQTLEADKVVLATGIRPNLDWLEGSGVRVEQGVVVDSRLQSSVEGVFAAGDVAQVSSGTGESRVMATEPAARDQGRVAGANMAGAEAVYRASPLMNIVSLGGLEAASFGHWQDQVPGSPPASSETIIHSRPGEFSYRRYSLREGRLAGALFLAPSAETWSTNDLGMIGGLVASGVDISEWVGFLKRRPLEINKPFLACGALPELLPRTVLPGT
ncbi:MAG: FAD-dependent oxidoreductase, partial [Deltaproteobacteria bacterium]|nr:FAD-dependent oxidoreductase [Deltaproteobacteria bacterium]